VTRPRFTAAFIHNCLYRFMLGLWSRKIFLTGRLYDKEQYVDCKLTRRLISPH